MARRVDGAATLLSLAMLAWEQDPATGPYPSGHGSLQHAETTRVVREALDTIVLPGFAAVGVTSSAR